MQTGRGSPSCSWPDAPPLQLRLTLAPPWDLGPGWGRVPAPTSAARGLRRHLGVGSQWRITQLYFSQRLGSQPGQTVGSEGWGHTELGQLNARIIHPCISDVLMVPTGCSPAGTSDSDLGGAREAEGKPIYGPLGMCQAPHPDFVYPVPFHSVLFGGILLLI